MIPFLLLCFSLPIAHPSSWKRPAFPLSSSFLDHCTLLSLSLLGRKSFQHSCPAVMLLYCDVRSNWGENCRGQLRCSSSQMLLLCSEMQSIICCWSRAAGETGLSVCSQAEEPCISSRNRVTAVASGMTMQHEGLKCCKDSNDYARVWGFSEVKKKTQIKPQLNKS